MKIFNVENDEEIVYIQKKDVIEILKNDSKLFNLFLIDSFDKYKKEDFIKYNNKEVINYLKNLKWIVDFYYYRFSSDNDMKEECDTLNSLIQMDKKEYNKTRSINLLKKINMLKYKLNQLIALQLFKCDKLKLNIPFVLSNKSMNYINNDVYEVKECLDYNKIIIYKKDKSPFIDKNFLDMNYFNKIITLITLEKNFTQELACDFFVRKKLSEDKKMIIVEFKQKHKCYEEINREKQEDGKIKKLINFVKNNKNR